MNNKDISNKRSTPVNPSRAINTPVRLLLGAAIATLAVVAPSVEGAIVVRNTSAPAETWNADVENWKSGFANEVKGVGQIPTADDDVYVGDIDIPTGATAMHVESLTLGYRANNNGTPKFNDSSTLRDTGTMNISGSGDTDLRLTVDTVLVLSRGDNANSTGTINHSSGKVVTDSLMLTFKASEGTYNLSGGKLQVDGTMHWGSSASSVSETNGGTGTFSQSGGAVQVNKLFRSRSSDNLVTDLKSHYIMTGGTLDVTTDIEFTRAFGFYATDATITVGGNVLLASSLNSSNGGQSTLFEMENGTLDIVGYLSLSGYAGTASVDGSISKTTLSGSAMVIASDLVGVQGDLGTNSEFTKWGNSNYLQKTELNIGPNAGIWLLQSNYTEDDALAHIAGGWITGNTQVQTALRDGQNYTVIGVVPEPASLSLLGLGALGLLRRRRNA